MKNSNEIKQLKKHNKDLEKYNVELFKKAEKAEQEKNELLFEKENLDKLKTKLISEYFLNAELERKRVDSEIKLKETSAKNKSQLFQMGTLALPLITSLFEKKENKPASAPKTNP